MGFIDHVLQQPSYGWANDQGELIIPTKRQLLKEAFSRINIFRSKKNWLASTGWFMVLCMMPFFIIFLVHYFSWKLLILFIIYSMIIMGTHGTIWYHRFCTHKSYTFSHPFWRIFTQNLIIKTLPKEI